MRKQYLEMNRTPEDIAEECGVSVETLQPFITKLQKGEKFDEFTKEYLLKISAENYGGQATQLHYHSDFLSTSYRYLDDFEHEISEDLRKVVLEDEGILQQTVWDIVIFDCGFEAGTTAEKLANSVSWDLNLSLGQDLFTKVLSANFSSSFFTKCAILSEVLMNYSSDESLAEFIGYNDIGLPLAHRVNVAEKMSDLDEEDIDNLDYIDETWEQLCEALTVDKDGDYTSLSDMRGTGN